MGQTRGGGGDRVLILLLIVLFIVGLLALTGLGPMIFGLMHNARGRRRD